MNCGYLAEDKNSVTFYVSGNLVENCDGLESYDFCSVYKENNGNSKHHMRRKFLAFSNDIKHTAVCHTVPCYIINSRIELQNERTRHIHSVKHIMPQSYTLPVKTPTLKITC